MSYSRTFKYDLFISYASANDIDEAGRGKGWVAEFVECLRQVLRSRLFGTNELSIYYDAHTLGGNHELASLQEAARDSALFLAVASSAYKERSWTQKEIQAFCERADHTSRLFAIEYLPLFKGDSYVGPLADRKMIRFWDDGNDYGIDTTLTFGTDKYRGRINQLASQIAGSLQMLRNEAATPAAASSGSARARPAADPISDLADAIAEQRAADEHGAVKLVVGQTASDMDGDAERLGAYFAERGYPVVDAANLRQGGEDFKAEFREALRDAAVFALPIGALSGRTPPDLPEGYYATQLAIAAELGIKTLIWRRPTVEIAEIANPRHAQLVDGPHVIASTYNAFLEEVRNALAAAAEPRRGGNGEPQHGLIFIHADKTDRVAALKLHNELGLRNIESAVPMFEGPATDIRNDLIESLTSCDTLLLLHGQSGVGWLRAQFRALSKLRPKMTARVKAVGVGPPNDASRSRPEEIGYNAPDIAIVDLTPDWKSDPIVALMEARS